MAEGNWPEMHQDEGNFQLQKSLLFLLMYLLIILRIIVSHYSLLQL